LKVSRAQIPEQEFTMKLSRLLGLFAMLAFLACGNSTGPRFPDPDDEPDPDPTDPDNDPRNGFNLAQQVVFWV
jgi:hypothetical protein